MASELNLNQVHADLISDFLQLSRYQLTQRIKSIDHCFTNLLSYKIRDDETYNGDEVIKLVQDLQDIVLDEAKTELMDAVHTNVLLIQQLLRQAEEWHLTLVANISELENREQLNAIKEFDEKQRKNPEKLTITVSQAKQLIPIEDYGAATALKHEVVQLLAENDILKKKVQELEILTRDDSDGTMNPDSSELSRELEKAREEIETLKKSNTQDAEMQNVQEAVEKMKLELEDSRKITQEETEKLRQDLESREDKLRQVQSNLLLAEKELEKKLSEQENKFQSTGTYANMKKMLTQKNSTIKILRKKLAQFGVDDTGDEPEEDATTEHDE